MSEKATARPRIGSQAHHREACELIAGGVNSNVRLAGDAGPLCFAGASGAHLIDVDGNDYIDYALGMGPAILGHAPSIVVDAVARSLNGGQLYAGQSPRELELARRLRQHVPGAELIRIGMTGSEMVQAALRVARASTGRTRFVKFAGHYHGWFDNVLTNDLTFAAGSPVSTAAAKPITAGQTPEALTDTVVLPWNDLAALSEYVARFGNETAAIIMEAVMCNTGVIPPATGYLGAARQLCDQHGIIFIVDEVITGFRLGLGGAQEKLGVKGDLSIFAKALGGGIPIAALTGRESLMSLIGSGAVNHSGTYNSNLIAVSAAIATIDALAADEGAAYKRIEVAGQSLMDGMRELAKAAGQNLVVQGYPSVFHTSFSDTPSIKTLDDYRRGDEAKQRRFLGALLDRGVRPTGRGTWFVSAAHTESDVDATLSAVHAVLGARL
jgi:glutamate-1-semialdehyde 2,1-aminomutase